ncbi:MAG: CRISPR-associated protein Cas4 [Treponemataceae bacterium]|nr:CRISPR-associated protein Cas4 [Treponemataceae bacterium]
MHPESDYLPLSGLQHLRFCSRQCAFIHIEQLWVENFLTAAGRVLHEKVHSGIAESRNAVKTERNLNIASRTLGLAGQTDAVEFYSDGTVIPVEYKHGKPKGDTSDEVQLCAQAICLEEMLGCKITEAALYYFKIRKRLAIRITDELRKETADLADQFHHLVKDGRTPVADFSKKCESCSFLDSCFPDSAGRKKSVDIYIKRRIRSDAIPDDDL